MEYNFYTKKYYYKAFKVLLNMRKIDLLVKICNEFISDLNSDRVTSEAKTKELLHIFREVDLRAHIDACASL